MNYIARKIKAFGKITHLVRINFLVRLFAISECSLKACIKEPTKKAPISSCFSSLLQLPA